MTIFLSLVIAALAIYIGIEHDTRKHFPGSDKNENHSSEKTLSTI